MVVYGWDASDFDWARGPMDMVAARADGVQFFTHKATEGTKIRHVHYGEALNRARAAGIEFRGAYMVVRTPGNNGHGSIQQQVDYFLSYLDQQTPWWRGDPGFFLQMDTELWAPYDNVAPQYGVQACDLLRARTGKFVIHYAPRWAYAETIGGVDPLWGSSYGTNPAVPYRQAYPGDGSSGWTPYSGRMPTFLQFGSRLTIGSQPGCDANAFRGTIDQLRALISGGTDMAGINYADILRSGTADATSLDNVLLTVYDVARRLDKAVPAAAAGGVTQEMHNAAVAQTMNDPAWLAKFAAAVASHIHVN